jgi:hypothetical protein
MIKVNFKVTGLYLGINRPSKYNQNPQVLVDVNANPSVYDIMQAASIKINSGAVPSVTSFVFTPAQPLGSEDLAAIFVTYDDSRADKRDAGTYMLKDEYSSNITSTFQYYIYDENFKQLNIDNKFMPFNLPPEQAAEIKDGYTVVIRQVNIANGPIKSKFIQKKVVKLSK